MLELEESYWSLLRSDSNSLGPVSHNHRVGEGESGPVPTTRTHRCGLLVVLSISLGLSDHSHAGGLLLGSSPSFFFSCFVFPRFSSFFLHGSLALSQLQEPLHRAQASEDHQRLCGALRGGHSRAPEDPRDAGGERRPWVKIVVVDPIWVGLGEFTTQCS